MGILDTLGLGGLPGQAAPGPNGGVDIDALLAGLRSAGGFGQSAPSAPGSDPATQSALDRLLGRPATPPDTQSAVDRLLAGPAVPPGAQLLQMLGRPDQAAAQQPPMPTDVLGSGLPPSFASLQGGSAAQPSAPDPGAAAAMAPGSGLPVPTAASPPPPPSPAPPGGFLGSGPPVGSNQPPSPSVAGPTGVPQMGPRGFVGDFLDKLFLGGGIEATRTDEYRRQVRDYQMRQAGEVWNSLTPDQKKAYLTNPAEFGKAVSDNFATHTVAGGSTLVPGMGMTGQGPNGAPYTAPQLGNDNGRLFTQTPGASTITGFTGPKVNADGVDERTGFQFPVQRTQVVPSGSTPFATTTGGDAMPGAPTIGGNGLDGLNPQVHRLLYGGGAPPAGQGGSLDPRTFFKQFVAPHEGGLNPHDMNGSPTNYGINQAANPGVDVRKLTPDGAADIFANKYFGPSGAGSLPAGLAAMHADTAFINPSAAKRFLANAGGDPAKYMAQRQAWMNHMVATNPAAAPYAKAWNNRNRDLSAYAAAQGGGPGMASPVGGSATSSSATPLAAPRAPHLLASTDPRLRQFPAGSAVEEGADGSLAVRSPGYTPEVVGSMRKEVFNSPEYKNYAEAVPLVRAARQAMHDPSAMADLNLIEAGGRVFNPNAVVRQGTVKAFQETQGVPDVITGALNQLNNGGKNARLSPQTRGAIMAQIESRGAGLRTALQPTIESYGSLAKRKGIDPADILPPVDEIGRAPPTPGPPVHLDPRNPDAAFARLASGQSFIGPDGHVRTKP